MGGQGSLVYDHRGQRAHGLFYKLKCTKRNDFPGALTSFNWGATVVSAGTLYVTAGSEGALKRTAVGVGPFY